MASRTLTAKCHCGSVNFTIDVPATSLPLDAYLCHCSICRYITGAPCIFHTLLPPSVKPNFINGSSMDKMTAYSLDNCEGGMYFCSNCGCHIAAYTPSEDEWVVSSSIFDGTTEQDISVNRHCFSKSAKDGGIATMLEEIRGKKMGDWNPPADNERSKVVECEPEVGEDGKERLRAQCFCGGVSFMIKRPDEEILRDDFLKTFVSPQDKSKWVAALDPCNDCRLVTGTNVIGWCFTAASACEPPIPRDLVIGTMKTYASSPGVLRGFCGKCGATIVYSCESRTKEDGRQLIDVATGILRAPEGPMAGEWLTWRSQMWPDDYDEGFNKALQEGMDKWSVEKYGKTMNISID